MSTPAATPTSTSRLRSIAERSDSEKSTTLNPNEDVIDLYKEHEVVDPDDLGEGSNAPHGDKKPMSSEMRRIIWKQDLRIMPIVGAVWFLCSLDRTNVGNAVVMNTKSGDSLLQSLHMTELKYKISLQIFYIFLTLLDVPSSLVLKRVGASRWLAFLVTGFGSMTMALASVNDFSQFTAIRVFLAAFEAAVFPSLMTIVNFHFRHEENGVRCAFILCSSSLAGAFGGAIATGVSYMNGIAGLEAWRWLVLIEGAPSVILGVIIFFCLPDWPETSGFLTEHEKRLVKERLYNPNGHAAMEDKLTWADIKTVYKDWRAWFHYLTWMGLSAPFSSIGLFAPTIVKGLGKTGIHANLYTVPPYAAAWVCSLSAAWAADRYNKRGIVASSFALVASICFFLLGGLPADTHMGVRYGLLMVALPASLVPLAALLSWLSANARGTTALVVQMSTNATLGALCQMIGVWIYRSHEAPRFPTGQFINGASLLLTVICSAILTVCYTRWNRHLPPAQRWVT